MKNLLLTTILILFSTVIFAQAWTSIGLKVGGGTTFLMNKNLFNDNGYTHEFGRTYNFGGKFGLNFGEHTSITFDAMISRHEQPFNYVLNEQLFHNTITWENLDLYLLYRNHRAGAYFELGPMLSTIRRIEQTDTGVGLTPTTDVTKFYTDRYLSGVLGVGSYIVGSGKFTTMIGLRIHYALQDIVTDTGKNPTEFEHAFPNPSGHVSTYVQERSPTNTNPLFVEFIVEFNFGLGFFAKAACSNRIAWFGGGS